MSQATTDHPVLDPEKAPPFPQAAFAILRNTQLRKNVEHATDVIHGVSATIVPRWRRRPIGSNCAPQARR